MEEPHTRAIPSLIQTLEGSPTLAEESIDIQSNKPSMTYAQLYCLAGERRRLRLDIHHRIQSSKCPTTIIDHLSSKLQALPQKQLEGYLIGKPHAGIHGVYLDTGRLDRIVPSDVFEEKDQRVNRFKRVECFCVERV